MEILITTISFTFLFGLITVPIVLFNAIKKWNRFKFDFHFYAFTGIFLTTGIIWTFAWWSVYSDVLLLNHYGYDFEAMNDIERYGNVEKSNLNKVKSIESAHHGIGWPLKAMMAFVHYLPYLGIIYLIGLFLNKIKCRRRILSM